MTCRVEGLPVIWDGERDDEGHRTYNVTHLVITDSPGSDDPSAVMRCPGLPVPGEEWTFGRGDIWAWCRWNMKVVAKPPQGEGVKPSHYLVTQSFSTKPVPRNQQRCQDAQVEDPLLEPFKVSGNFHRYQEEGYLDRFGSAIVNTAYEMFSGPQNEWDRSRPSIKIEQNVSSPLLAYILPAQLIDCVNAFSLWGLPPRCIKLSSAPWERKYWGRCNVYYTRTLEFDINYDTFDRNLRDEGNKVLRGHWNNTTGHWVLDNVAGVAPSRWNPADFIRFKDRNGENTRVILNGSGLPAGVQVDGRAFPIQGPYPAVDRATVVRATQWAYTLAADSARNLRQLQNEYLRSEVRAILTLAQVAELDARIVEAVNLGNEYEDRARLAAGNASGADSSTTAGQANVAGSSYMVAANALNQFLTTSLGNQNLRSVQDLLMHSDCVGRNSTEAYRASNDALREANRVDALPGTLTGTGTTVAGETTTPGYVHVEKYNECDFLILGIPTTF